MSGTEVAERRSRNDNLMIHQNRRRSEGNFLSGPPGPSVVDLANLLPGSE